MRAQRLLIWLDLWDQLVQPLQQPGPTDRLAAKNLAVAHVRLLVPDREAPRVRRPSISGHGDDLLTGAGGRHRGVSPDGDRDVTGAIGRRAEQPADHRLGTVGTDDRTGTQPSVQHDHVGTLSELANALPAELGASTTSRLEQPSVEDSTWDDVRRPPHGPSGSVSRGRREAQPNDRSEAIDDLPGGDAEIAKNVEGVRRHTVAARLVPRKA